jgi:RHS repeat-associated protein
MDMGWTNVTTASNFAKQKLALPTVMVKEAGFVFVYLSYESQSNNYVYFDDFKVTHTKTNILQYNEYYPFGLQTANSWTRDNTAQNNFLANGGTELNTTSQLYDLEYRNYDPVLGRMNQVDPMSEKYSSHTPYNYAFNSPVVLNDPQGDDPIQWGFWEGGAYASAMHRRERLESQGYHFSIDYFNSSRYRNEFGGGSGQQNAAMMRDQKEGLARIGIGINFGNFWSKFVPWAMDQGSGVAIENGQAGVWLSSDTAVGYGGFIGEFTVRGIRDVFVPYILTYQYQQQQQTQGGPGDPLKDSHGYPVFTLEQFLEANGGKSFNEIISQGRVRNGLPGGPQMRMVLNPRDGNIMDMRHVMVVGYQYGRVGGYVFEISQFVRGIAQAFNGQDLYSNAIGDDFAFQVFSTNWKGTQDWSKDFYDWMNRPK